jgi:hypothetical protein
MPGLRRDVRAAPHGCAALLGQMPDPRVEAASSARKSASSWVTRGGLELVSSLGRPEGGCADL